MLFMGDSATYLHTAFKGGIPEDRSFVYGYLVRFFGVWTGSLYFLVVAQVVASLGTALLVYHSLKTYFSVRPWIALSSGLVFALDPLQLMYERFVMAEALSLLVFALYCLQIFRYLKLPTWPSLIWIHLTGVTLISLRLSFLMLVLAAGLLLPLLGTLRLAKISESKKTWNYRSLRTAWKPALMHVTVSLIVLVAFHSGYRLLNGQLLKGPPAYQASDGFWLISAWAPVLKAEDSRYPKIADLIARGDAYELHNIYVRNGHRYSANGLVARLVKIEFNTEVANRHAKEIAMNALKRDPMGMIKLGLETYNQFFRRDIIPVILRDDQGFDPNSRQGAESMMQVIGLPKDLTGRVTQTKAFYSRSVAWFHLLLQTPWIALLSTVLCVRGSRESMFFLFAISLVLLATICVLSVAPVFRFLHPFSFVAVIALGAGAERLVRFKRA